MTLVANGNRNGTIHVGNAMADSGVGIDLSQIETRLNLLLNTLNILDSNHAEEEDNRRCLHWNLVDKKLGGRTTGRHLVQRRESFAPPALPVCR